MESFNKIFRCSKIKFTLFLLIVSSFLNLSGQNQKTIDSLKILVQHEKSEKNKALILSQIAEEFYFNIPDSAIKYCKMGMYYSYKNKDIPDLAYFHTFLGVLYKNISSYDSAIVHLQESIKLNIQDNFENGVAAGYNNIGQVYLLKGDYDNALKSYSKSLELFEKYKDTLNIGELHSNIGSLMMKIGEYKSAEEHFMLSQKYYKMAGVKLQEAWILYDMGNLKLKTKDFNASILYFKESSKIWTKFNRIKEYLNCMLRIGEVLIEQNNCNKASEILSSTIKKFKEINNPQGVSESYYLLGKAQFKLKKFKKAIDFYKNSLEISDFLKSAQLQTDVYFDLYISYKEIKQQDTALFFLEKHLALKDSVFNQNKSKIIAEYQTKLSLLNKELIIRQLEDSTQKQVLKNEYISIENKQKQISIYFLIAGIIAISLVLYLLYRRNHTINKLNNELNISLKEREVLIREVHHRVKNNLQIISSLLNLQCEKTTNANPKELLQISQSRIEAMSMIHETLYKSSLISKIDFKDYIENLCHYISTSFSLSEKEILIKFNLDSVQVEIDQLVPCGLVINELITNSIKHAFTNQDEKIITISCFANGDKIKIEISDNGVGLPADFKVQESKSLGMRLASGLVRQLNANLKFENRGGLVAHFEFINKKKQHEIR